MLCVAACRRLLGEWDAVTGRPLPLGLSALFANEGFWGALIERACLLTPLFALPPCPAAILVLLLRRLGDSGAWSDVESDWDTLESDSEGLP